MLDDRQVQRLGGRLRFRLYLETLVQRRPEGPRPEQIDGSSRWVILLLLIAFSRKRCPQVRPKS